MSLRTLRSIRRVRRVISVRPNLYFPLARLSGNRRLLRETADLVVDGFPRSANSYVEAAFAYSQSARRLTIATHSHAAAQILRSVEWGLPTVVLIRQPDEAVASMMEMQKGAQALDQFQDYTAFYRPLLPLIEKVVIAEFSTVISQFDKIVKRVNQKFATDLEVPQINDEFKAGVDQEVQRISWHRMGRIPPYSSSVSSHARAERRARQDRFIEDVRSSSDRELKRAREEALDLFSWFTKSLNPK